jgi:hypothetical protein
MLSLVKHDIYVSVRFVTLLHINKYQAFIGALAILRKATNGFVMSACLPVRPSVYMAQLGSRWTDAKVLKKIKKRKSTKNMKQQQRLDPKFTTDCFQVDAHSCAPCLENHHTQRKKTGFKVQSVRCSYMRTLHRMLMHTLTANGCL